MALGALQNEGDLKRFVERLLDQANILHPNAVRGFEDRAARGEYFPTLNGDVNVTLAEPVGQGFHWSRQQDKVTMFGRFQLDPAATGQAEFHFAFPDGLETDLETSHNVAGVAAHVSSGVGQIGEIAGSFTDDWIVVQCNCTSAASLTWSFMLGYYIREKDPDA
jgi:hypothetical protein